jgi:hypothetical protein
MPEPQSRSPYQGLIPYDEEDAPFFFGREKETRLIGANLFAAPLTLLYGASGVGKSSVLRAGVVHQLRPREDLLLVIFSAWQSDPIGGLKATVAEAAARVSRDAAPLLDSAPLSEYFAECAARLDRRLMIILDQFEEYFLYHRQGDAFAAEFPHAVNQADLPVSFLVSMREDSLAKLDRFEGRIPNLFDNYLRIEHLDREAARQAIEKPIEQYNCLRAGDDSQVEIEAGLVEAVLQQVRTGEVVLGEAGRGVVGAEDDSTPAEMQIETPYLQLVMTRLWKEEMDAGSRVLRLETLNGLGGAERIVRTHLDGVMNGLPPTEQDAASRVFHHLVTPSGTKIAHSIHDLAEYADLPETQVSPVLKELSDPEIRILRSVAPPPDQPATYRYEIFHDVLAPAILDWRARYVQAQELAQERKRQRIRFLQVLLGMLLVFSVVFYWAYTVWLENRPWGYMRNLSTGTVHALRGDLVSIGRSTEFQNTINLRPRTVSRIHLQVSKNLSAFDWRSLNGTTINGEFLPYGKSRKINKGDIAVLAGIAPFQFHTIEYSLIPFWTPSIEKSSPPSGWGMLIDGRSRSVMYLNQSQYFLSLDKQNRIVLRDEETDSTLLRIRRDDNGRITITDREDGIDLLAKMKEGDYNYPVYRIPPEQEFDSFKAQTESHDIFEVAYSYRGVPFQIVQIAPNLEPPKSSR